MQSAYHTLKAVTGTLSAKLHGCRIREAFSQERDEAVIAFSGAPTHLVVSCRSDFLACYLHPTYTRARKNSADVLAAALNYTVEDVTIRPDDRWITIHLSGGAALHLQLFGGKANVVFTDASSIIVDAFKRAKELAGLPLPVSAGSAMGSPQEILDRVLAHPAQTLRSALKVSAPQLAPVVVREILHRADLAPELPVAAASADAAAALRDAVAAVVEELAHPTPRIYARADGTPLHFSIIPLLSLDGSREDRFEDIHHALRTFIGWKRSAEERTDEQGLMAQRLRTRIEHARRIVAAIDADMGSGDRAEQYMLFGSLLLQHLTEIPPGAAQTTIEGADGPVIIPLAPTQTASQNAQRYFEKSKTSKRARELAGRRRQFTVTQMERTAALLADLEHAATRQDLKTFMEDHKDDVREGRGTGPADELDRPLFREFVVEGGFEVWAGRTSANNDLLTLRHARPQDYWFHARSVPGSHVILRVATGHGGPGKRAIQQAAAIAAYYSKMRTATMVPVTVTLRKYVHKPKGAKPGSVVLQREDVIMVEPALPQHREDTDE